MVVPIELILSFWNKLSIKEKQNLIKELIHSLPEKDKKLIQKTILKELKKWPVLELAFYTALNLIFNENN